MRTRNRTCQPIVILLILLCLLASSTFADKLGDREGARKKSDSGRKHALPSFGIRGGYLGSGNFSLTDDFGTTDFSNRGSYTFGVFFEGTAVSRLMVSVGFDFSHIVIDEIGGRRMSYVSDSSRFLYELDFSLKYRVSSATTRWDFRPYGTVGIGAANKIEPLLDRSLVMTGRLGIEALYKTAGKLGFILDFGMLWLPTGSTKILTESQTISGGPAPYFRFGFRIGNNKPKG